MDPPPVCNAGPASGFPAPPKSSFSGPRSSPLVSALVLRQHLTIPAGCWEDGAIPPSQTRSQPLQRCWELPFSGALAKSSFPTSIKTPEGTEGRAEPKTAPLPCGLASFVPSPAPILPFLFRAARAVSARAEGELLRREGNPAAAWPLIFSHRTSIPSLGCPRHSLCEPTASPGSHHSSPTSSEPARIFHPMASGRFR